MRELLVDGAKELGIELNYEQVEQLMRYKALLQLWNERMNLTSIIEDREIITKHFLDCMTVYQSLDLYQQKTLIDIGTGAGFPGLVLKIVFPHLEVTLVDSLKKRLNFLNVVIEGLELTQITCLHSRAEDLGKNKAYREKFDVCASRAVAPLVVLSEYTLPFVRIDGYLIALKGQKLEEELEQSQRAIDILGGMLEETYYTGVPFTDLNHQIVKVKKIKETPEKYPRKAGEPSKSPLK